MNKLSELEHLNKVNLFLTLMKIECFAIGSSKLCKR